MAKQIESLNVEVAGSLSIEELEERLETQVLRMPEAACDWSCGEVCSGGYGCTTVCTTGAECNGFRCGEFCRDAQVQ